MAEAPSRVGRYEIVREIGRGGMGVVYEARDPALDRTVAVKVIQPAGEDQAARALEERFLAEARIAAALHHPGIVVVHDVGRDPATGALFIALELLEGPTLAEVGARGPLGWRSVLQIVGPVARALHHAHVHGVVHRDVKPANVVVLASGEVKITDFGIARLESGLQRLTTTGEFIGTPLYTAPEQAKTEDVDGRADVFSLGSVAYTLLTGQAAFSAPTIPGIVHRVVYEDPVPPSRYVPDLPADLERVLARSLEKDPSRRYPTAQHFAEDAEDLLAGRPPRHVAGDELVVVGEGGSPPAGLVSPTTRPPATTTTPVRPSLPDTRSLPLARMSWPRPRAGRIAAGVAVGLALVALLLWIPWPRAVPSPPPPPPPGAASPRPARPAPTPAAQPAPAQAARPAAAREPGHLRIDFDHPLRTGTVRVFVDDELAVEERLRGQQRTKALLFKMHEGTFQNVLEIQPGLHEIRLEVQWDDNVRTERIVGSFASGATRTLEASLGRIRRDLSLEWK
jgi:eukaryotic-like serine/threonine-protein kinase